MGNECRELTEAELDGIVGGLAGEFRFTKLQRAAAVRQARASYAPAVPSFRWPVAAGGPAAAPAAPKAPRCTGPWCA